MLGQKSNINTYKQSLGANQSRLSLSNISLNSNQKYNQAFSKHKNNLNNQVNIKNKGKNTQNSSYVFSKNIEAYDKNIQNVKENSKWGGFNDKSNTKYMTLKGNDIRSPLLNGNSGHNLIDNQLTNIKHLGDVPLFEKMQN